jgi:hypothetical protein
MSSQMLVFQSAGGIEDIEAHTAAMDGAVERRMAYITVNSGKFCAREIDTSVPKSSSG